MGFLDKKYHDPNIIIVSLESALNWARKNSLWYEQFGLACCAIEMMATAASDTISTVSVLFRARLRDRPM